MKTIVLVLSISLAFIGVKAQSVDSAGTIKNTIGYITATKDSLYMYRSNEIYRYKKGHKSSNAENIELVAELSGPSRFKSVDKFDHFPVIGNKIFYYAQSGRLMVYDGSTDSARTLALIAGTTHSALVQSTGTRLFIAGGKQSTGQRELWVSDGTPSGTVMIKKIADGVSNTNAGIREIISVNNNAVLVVSPDGFKKELWVSDGTDAGTAKIVDLDDGTATATSFYKQSAVFKGKLLFTDRTGTATNKHDLYATDGTLAGTQKLLTTSTEVFREVTEALAGQDKIYFNGYHLSVYDGTTLTELRERSTGYEQVFLGAVINDNAYFTVKNINKPNNDSMNLMRVNASSKKLELLYTNDSMTINNYYPYGDSLLFVGNDNGSNQVFISKDVNGANQTFRLNCAEQYKKYNLFVNDVYARPFETYKGEVFFASGSFQSGLPLLFKIGNEKAPVGIFNQSQSGISAAIYPNPASQSIYLDNIPDKSSLKIFSITGQLVYEQDTLSKDQSVDVSSLTNGMYVLHIQQGQEIGRVKLSISK